MRYFATLLVCIWATCLPAQQPTPTYTASTKTNDHIGSIEEETEWSLGCSSIYCAVNYQIVVSSEVAHPEDAYGANSLKDFDLTSPWIAQKGIGEFFEYTVTERNRPQNKPNLGFTEFYIFSGHRKNMALWNTYARPKKLKMFVNDQLFAYINLSNTYKQQTVKLAPIGLSGKKTVVKFEIMEVYAGKKPAVAIAEIAFDGIGIF